MLRNVFVGLRASPQLGRRLCNLVNSIPLAGAYGRFIPPSSRRSRKRPRVRWRRVPPLTLQATRRTNRRIRRWRQARLWRGQIRAILNADQFNVSHCHAVNRKIEAQDRESHLRYAAVIDDFIDGRGPIWEWDDFTSVRQRDAYLESVRLRCLSVRDEFPPEVRTHYCNAAGVHVLRSIASGIRART
jgi:hypothetical protein